MTEFLQKLLNGQKVEWKKLGEVCEVQRGSRLTKKELSDEYQYPVFHGGLIPLGYYNQYNRKANQTMIINTGSIGEVVWSGVDFWSSDGTFVIKTPDDIDDRFLYFFLKIHENYFKSQRREGGVPTINRDAINTLPIPIPPLPVQKEIVQILDTLTTHTAELTAELTARKKQYNYYREKLLTFKDGEVEWKKLGEVVNTVTAPTKLQKQSYCEFGKIPIIDQGIDFIAGYTDEDLKPVEAGEYVIFGDHSEHIKYVDFSFIQGADGLKILKPIKDNAKYIYYAFQNFYIKELNYKRHWSTAKDTSLPIPPLSVQKEIVQTLDKFDALTNSTKEGLHKKIELRTKQYEYYRNQLLNFPK